MTNPLVHYNDFPRDWKRFLAGNTFEGQYELIAIVPDETIDGIKTSIPHHLYLIQSNWEVEIRVSYDTPFHLCAGMAMVEQQDRPGEIPKLYVCMDDVPFLHRRIMLEDQKRGYG